MSWDFTQIFMVSALAIILAVDAYLWWKRGFKATFTYRSRTIPGWAFFWGILFGHFVSRMEWQPESDRQNKQGE